MMKTLLRDLSLRLFVAFAFATFAVNARAGAVAFDASGNLFAVEHWRSIAKFTGDGIQSTFGGREIGGGRNRGRVYIIHRTNGLLGGKKIRTKGCLHRLFGQPHTTSISPAVAAESWLLSVGV